MNSNARRWLWLLLLVPLAIGLTRLRFDVDVLNLLPAQLPVVEGLKLYQRHFANAQELIITVRAVDAETTETATRSLAEMLRTKPALIRSAIWQPPWLENPVSSAELIAYLWFNQPPEVFGQLTNRLALENVPATLKATQERLATTFSPQDMARLARDPFDLMQLPESVAPASGLDFSQKMFASDDGKFRLIHIHPAKDPSNYREGISLLKNVKSSIEDWRRAHPAFNTVKINFTGGPAFAAEIGSGMESDLTGPSLGTLAVIALLFYFTHRRWLPLVWLIVLLLLILAATLALGGFFYGTLSVVSLGFASILLGLAEDFGIVLYQESRTHPELSVAEIRRAASPGIFWSAVTTSGAFLLLNLSGVPGLGQLGSLVAIGIILAAFIMLYGYLPPLLRRRINDPSKSTSHFQKDARNAFKPQFIWTATALVILLGGIALWQSPPKFDRSPESLRPKQSDAYDTMTEIKKALSDEGEPIWVIVQGETEKHVAETLAQIQPVLENATSQGTLAKFILPASLWPKPNFQKANSETALQLAAQNERLVKAAMEFGFENEALAMTGNILETWKKAAASKTTYWPTNENSRWVLDNATAKGTNGFFALGLLFPAINPSERPQDFGLRQSSGAFGEASDHQKHQRTGAVQDAGALSFELPSNVKISSWDLLGPAISQLVLDELPKVALPILLLVIVSLWLAFRSFVEVALSLATLVVSGIGLALMMSLFGWSWNMMNLMALPLLLGLGVDFSIHIQLALRRYSGNLSVVQNSIGRALLLAGSTTVAGFGSLVFSSNAGLASLGKVCAVGIACMMLTAVYLLPTWWSRFGVAPSGDPTRQPPEDGTPNKTHSPSSLYRVGFWRLGIRLTRLLPQQLCETLARVLGWIYWRFAHERCGIVTRNLLPVLQNNRDFAKMKSRLLFQQFALKLIDLWRFEAGQSNTIQFAELTGWKYFLEAQARGKGVLLVTPHLGNWEFGGPLMRQHAIDLYVVTLREPDDDLTAIRQAARARIGIKTVVIGEDPFTFVEIIKRLEAGATVAILIDRPPSPAAVNVELFGKAFNASISAAELARASGCAILPVFLPRTPTGYAAHVLPEIAYNRAALNSREARRQFTQEIMRAFEPAIRQYPEQWYHFVPVWAES